MVFAKRSFTCSLPRMRKKMSLPIWKGFRSPWRRWGCAVPPQVLHTEHPSGQRSSSRLPSRTQPPQPAKVIINSRSSLKQTGPFTINIKVWYLYAMGWTKLHSGYWVKTKMPSYPNINYLSSLKFGWPSSKDKWLLTPQATSGSVINRVYDHLKVSSRGLANHSNATNV